MTVAPRICSAACLLGLLGAVAAETVSVTDAPSDESCLLQVSLKMAHGSGRTPASASVAQPQDSDITKIKRLDTFHQQSDLGTAFWMGIPLVLLCGALIPFIVQDLRVIADSCRSVGKVGKDSIELNNPASEDTLELSSSWGSGSTCFETPELSMALMTALTAPNFCKGCILGTLMSYLLAAEGPRIAGSASIFMGLSMAVFAMSVAILPAIGKISDWLVVKSSHAVGRRFTLLTGILVCTLSIYGCAISSEREWILLYFFSVFTMGLGIASFSVASAAVVLELVPETQSKLVTAFKSAMFFIGCAVSFVAVMCSSGPPSWLYYYYGVVTLACVLPGAVFLLRNRNLPTRSDSDISLEDQTLSKVVWSAYTSAMEYNGCFPRLCIASFVHHIGVAPIFMLILQLHDVVGFGSEDKLRMQWGCLSIVSTFLATVASMVFALQVQRERGESTKEQTRDNILIRLQPWALACAVTTALIPVIGFFGQPGSSLRVVLMYILCGALCWSIGACQALWQEAVRMFLPEHGQFANAMCFLVACNFAGIGIGSLNAGFLLQIWATGDKSYEVVGYAVLALVCLLLGLLSVYLIPRPEQVDTPEHPDRSRWLSGISFS